MRTATIILTAVAMSAMSTQIHHMDLDTVLPFAGTIAIAELVSVDVETAVSWTSGEFTFRVVEPVVGTGEPGEELVCMHSVDHPGCFIDEYGNEIWESPLTTGSGMEFGIAPGDTVIILFESDIVFADRSYILLRAEPLESLDTIMDLLEPECY